MKKNDDKTLTGMLLDDNISSDSCLDYYIEKYEDTDIMTQRDVEATAYDLSRSSEKDDINQAKRLIAMLDANPNMQFFDYYNEKPIKNKIWLKQKFGLLPKKKKDKKYE